MVKRKRETGLISQSWLAFLTKKRHELAILSLLHGVMFMGNFSY